MKMKRFIIIITAPIWGFLLILTWLLMNEEQRKEWYIVIMGEEPK